jgi:hypothetical protein
MARHDIPWKTLDTDLGDVPFYVIQFDKDGECTSPQALTSLVEASRSRSDIFVFAHGWNNDWEAATARYDDFIERFTAVRRAQWSPPDREFTPVLVGVFWPSTALVMPSEQGPDIAGVDPADEDLAVVEEALAPEQQQRLRALVTQVTGGGGGLKELAGIVASALGEGDDELAGAEPAVSADELLEVWQGAFPEAERQVEPGGFIEDEGEGLGDPDAAGFDPLGLVRKVLRLATVQRMKDRAGRVGGNGVAAMLRRLANESDGRIHLVGHSYGAKVVLSALCHGPAPGRDVDSVLLLQPALSAYAFTDDFRGRRGGYRDALDRVRQPIIATRSRHDSPLRRFFHLAVRRRSDLAEAQIAGKVSDFAALGGFGPQLVPGGVEDLVMPDVGDAYPLAAAHRVIAVDGTGFISGHGDVESDQTAWALLSQVKG